MTLSELDKIDVHFIIGPGRSGTTLLVNLLREHDNCIVNGEIDFFLFFYRKYKNIHVVSNKLVDDLKNYIEHIVDAKPIAFSQRIDYTYLNLLEVGKPISYQQIIKIMHFVFNSKNKNTGAITTIIDKHPYYNYHAEKIIELFPNAKCIGLIRDYRAFVNSNLSSPEKYIPTFSVNYYALSWRNNIKSLLKDKKSYPNNIKIVKYEDWMNESENYLKEMLDYFSLTHTFSMNDFYLKNKKILDSLDDDMKKKISKRTLSILTKLSRPINPDRVNTWREKLSTNQIQQCEMIANRYGSKIGYYSMYPKVNFIKRIFYFIRYLHERILNIILFKLRSIKIKHFVSVTLTKRYLRRKGLAA